jgi:Tol biopolymer transport system component
VAFDVSTTSQDDILSGRHYNPDSGLQIFDQTTFSGNFGNSIFNPAWSPDPSKITWMTGNGERRVLQLFDMKAKTAVTLLDWDPARFGALIPSPLWSPDGQWLALEVWANGLEGSGIWLLAADGSSQTLVNAEGHEPHWVSNTQLVFGVNNGTRLYDVNSGETFKMDLPEGSWILEATNLADLVAQAIPVRVADTSVAYVLAMQDVPMFSGDDDSYEQIGTIFGGQTALVTGQSLETNWWRVICPDDTIGDCWLTDDTAYTVPVDTPNPITELPDPADLTMSVEQTTSPDGRWQADAAQSESVLIIDRYKYFVSLTVTDGTTTWTPVAEWRNDGLGAHWLAVFRWSVDGRYLYYTNTGSADGCSRFVNGTDLYRLDVSNGEVIEILPEGKTLNLSLSPDESMLAYASYDGQSEVLAVQDLATGTERSVRLFEPNSNTQMSEIFWSGDGKTAVLTLIHGACSPRQTSSIVRINIEDMTTTTLITDDERFFRILDWPNPDQAEIPLADKDGTNYRLEINSGELAQEE